MRDIRDWWMAFHLHVIFMGFYEMSSLLMSLFCSCSLSLFIHFTVFHFIHNFAPQLLSHPKLLHYICTKAAAAVARARPKRRFSANEAQKKVYCLKCPRPKLDFQFELPGQTQHTEYFWGGSHAKFKSL